MFLALTANNSFQDPGRPTTYLGEWCVAHHGAVPLDGPVLPYALADPEAQYEAYKYCDNVYQRFVPQLAAALNRLHRVEHSLRYWEIYVGYWLREYVEVLYDRYRAIKTAAKLLGPEVRTKLLDQRCYHLAEDGRDFSLRCITDLYNQQLFSQIIRFLGVFDCETVRVDPTAWDRDTGSRREGLPEGIKSALKWACLLGSRRNHIYLSATYLPAHTLFGVSARLGVFPNFDVPRFRFSTAARSRADLAQVFCQIKPRDQFGALLGETLADNLPQTYAESFEIIQKRAARYYPRRTKLIVTANSFASNDGFRIWAADQTERHHVPYVIHQHGGNYGSGRWNSSEDYEIRVADYFLTYGWNDPRSSVTSFYFSRMYGPGGSRVQGKSQGDILWVLASLPRYAYTMYSVPAASPFRDYLSDQARFFGALSPMCRAFLKCRPYRHDYGWDDIATIERQAGVGPIAIDPLKRNLRKRMLKARLLVCTHNGTTHLESMSANVPTIIYWNPEHWQIREEARELMDELRAVGILHDVPQDAATKVNEISDNVFEWWHENRVQELRNRFCRRFARIGDRPVRSWTEWLRNHAHPTDEKYRSM